MTAASRLTDIGVEAATGIRNMLTRAVDGKPTVMYIDQDPLPWTTVRSGGWDLLATGEESGGAGATLRDAVQVAQVWGEFIVPSPLMISMMAKRFSEQARKQDDPVTVAVMTPSSRPAALAPFGGHAGVLDGHDGDGVRLEAVPDEFAPSLKLARVPAATRLDPNSARELAVVWAAEATGCARRMLHVAVEYSKERQQFNQPIGKFQIIKHYLADALVMTEAAETAVLLACSDTNRSSAATRYAFDSALKVAETAIQVHGGMGFTWEMGLHFYLRHIAMLRDFSASLEF